MHDHWKEEQDAAEAHRGLETSVERLGDLVRMRAPKQVLRGEFALIAGVAADWLRVHGASNAERPSVHETQARVSSEFVTIQLAQGGRVLLPITAGIELVYEVVETVGPFVGNSGGFLMRTVPQTVRVFLHADAP